MISKLANLFFILVKHSKIVRNSFLLFIFFACSISYSSTIYWVGGNGNWNDGNHWSLSSGGVANGIIPTQNDNVFFDENSNTGIFTVNIYGNNYCKDFKILSENSNVNFVGGLNDSLKVFGAVQFKSGTNFNFLGDVEFRASSFNNVINTIGKLLLCTFDFSGSGSWNLLGMNGKNTLNIKHTNGTLILDHEAILCRSFMSSGGSLQINKGAIVAPHSFSISSNVTTNISSKLFISAPTSDTALFKVPASLNSSKYSASNSQLACSITLASVVFFSCTNSCSAVVTFNVPAGCTAGPYSAEWALNATPQFTVNPVTVVGGLYTQNNVCASGFSYSIVFFNSSGAFVTALAVSVTQPAKPTVTVIAKIKPTCFGDCDGKIVVQAVDPYPTYTFSYIPVQAGYPRVGILANTPDTLKNICVGSYSVVVSNLIGCADTVAISLSQPSVISIASTPTNVECNGTCSGSAGAPNAATGGNGGFTYSWAGPSGYTSTLQNPQNFCVGVYTCTITDSKGCTASYNATITQPLPLSFSVASTNPLCGDVCNGTATISQVSGGTGPYTISWLPVGTAGSTVGTSATATGLCPSSTYTATITDFQNCTSTHVFNIAGPTAIVSTVAQTNVLCFGGTTGTATGTATGGTGAYIFHWFNSVGIQISLLQPSLNALSAGTYSLQVLDQNNCDDTTTFIITEPLVLSATLTPISPTCNGVCDGSITLPTIVGGTTPYTYSWTGPSGYTSSLQVPLNFCIGTYTLVVTDFLLCQATTTVVITPQNPVVFATTITQPSCNGSSDGSVSVTATGGTGALILSWADCPACVFPRTGMSAGTYTVLSTNGANCVDNLIFTLTEPVALNVSLSLVAPIKCFGVCDAVINSTITGGTPLYALVWDLNPALNSPILNSAGLVCAGPHSLVVTDANGCVSSKTITLTEPTALTATLVPTQPKCFGQTTGTIDATVSGGTGTIVYSWAPGNQTSEDITSLGAGTYTLTVTDANLCSVTPAPSETIIVPTAIALNENSGDLTCSGVCDGFASVAPTGGTPGYTYSWSGSNTAGVIIDNLSSLCIGSYTVNVIDANLCPALPHIFTIAQPILLSVSVSGIVQSCALVCNGEASATGSGGTLPYTYSWAPGAQTGATPNTLCAGSNTVTVTDGSGCTSTAVFNVPSALQLTLTSTTNLLNCFGDCTGASTANATPGSFALPLSYDWQPSGQTTATATSLCAGTSTVTVTDGNGCSTLDSVIFTAPNEITSNITSVNLVCSGSNIGSATEIAGGGTGALTLNWMPGNFSSATITNLSAGIYTVTITDSNLCTKLDSVIITSPSAITATFTNTPPTTCAASDACLTVIPAGGTGGYSFLWSTILAQTTDAICSLSSGNYSVTITDGAGCDTLVQSFINDPLGPSFTISSTNAACNSGCDGSGSILALGVLPITISWPATAGNQIGSVATSLCANVYNVSIEDGSGCEVFASVTITEPTVISAGLSQLTNPTCVGNCDGEIQSNILGGTPNYTYLWTGPNGYISTLQNPQNFCAGVYDLNVIDLNSCPSGSLGPFTFIEPTPISFTAPIQSQNINCFGNCSGTAEAFYTGGLNTVVSWTGPSGFSAVTSGIVNLCNGTYTITLTDDNGCSILDSVKISEPSQLLIGLTSINALCHSAFGSATQSPTGGSGGYSFSWTPPNGTLATSSNLFAGSYTATVTDNLGCEDTSHFAITEPPALTIAFTSITNPICSGSCSGAANSFISGGSVLASYSYDWSPVVANTSNVSNLCAGQHTLTVTDDNNCSASSSFTLTDPLILQANITNLNATCLNNCAGQIFSSPVGGTPPYTTTSSSGSLIALCVGAYRAVVTDFNGCKDSSNVIIMAPVSLTITTGVTPSNCATPCLGTIDVLPLTGTPPYSYLWLTPPLNPSTNSSIDSVCSGIYNLELRDNLGCIDTFAVAVSDANGPDSATIVISMPSCYGGSNGSAAAIEVFNGLPGYLYSWNTVPVTLNDSVNSLIAGDYLLTITDANNCKFIPTVTILNKDSISLIETLEHTTCNGLCDGSIKINASGGTGSYLFDWTGPSSFSASTSDIVLLCAGTYSLTVTDSMGCSTSVTYIIHNKISLNATISSTDITCNGTADGTATINSLSGGTLPYTTIWNDPFGQTSLTASNLSSGIYACVLTDSIGCVDTFRTSLVNEPLPLAISSVITDAICGQGTGQIAISSTTGGTAPYTYAWNNSETGDTIMNLVSGVYALNVTDSIGCTVAPFNFGVSDIGGPTVTVSSTNPTCSVLVGSATVVVTGAAPPFQVIWIPGGAIGNSISNLDPGTYFVQGEDVNGCVSTQSFTLLATPLIEINQTSVQPDCDSCNGRITISATGGTAPYSFVWSNAANGDTLDDLCAGSYTLTITDGVGCSQEKIIPLSSANGFTLSLALDSALCKDQTNGGASLEIIGGTPGFTTLWSAGTPSLFGDSVSNLGAGNYSIDVTDNLGCHSVQVFTIEEPAPLSLSFSSLELPSCNAVCNGKITATPSGGTLSYSYAWLPGNQVGTSISNLCAGSYTLNVQDKNGCSVSQTSILMNNANLITALPTVTQPQCNKCNGAIILNALGGNLPYSSINWTNGSTTADLDSVCAGLYAVSITDSLGCVETLNFPISNSNGITGDSQIITNETCVSTCNGTATITPVGGIAPYNYLWLGTNNNTNTQIGLCAISSPYFLQIQDANSCIFTSQINIAAATQLSVTPTLTSPLCGASNGAISLSVSGGISPYTFVWNPPVSLADSAINLAAGNYFVTVNEFGGCSQNFIFSLSSASGPLVSAVVTNDSCHSQCNGSIALTISGGTPNYDVLWNIGLTNDTITGLCDTTFAVTVTDNLGCITSSNYLIAEPLPLQFSIANVQGPLCFGDTNGLITIIPSGGTLAYTFSWNHVSLLNTPTASNLSSGTYSVSITDANGCTISQSASIINPSLLVLNGVVIDATCSSLANGAIDLSVSGGTPGYTYNWATSENTEDLINIYAGNYSVIVSDTNFCKDSISFIVNSTIIVAAIASADDSVCDGNSLTLYGNTSTGAVAYSWLQMPGNIILGTADTLLLSAANNQPPSGVTTMYLFVAVNGLCSDTDTVMVSSINLPVADAGAFTTVLIYNSTTLGGNPSGSFGSTYLWTPGAFLNDSTIANPIASPTVTTTYTLTVANGFGCSIIDTVTVRVLPQIIFPNGITPNGDGKNDYWLIDNITLFPDCEVEIYNRWGEQLFYSRGYTTQWDGNYKGKPLPVGTYYYAIKLNSELFPAPFVGPITILR